MTGQKQNFMDDDVHEAPGEHIASEIEKIREKTFDTEFKELVSRVTSHRADERDLQKEAEKELLVRYQKLFYRASNLYWREGAYVTFDPFTMANAEIGEHLALEIFTEMDAMGFPHFAILTYDFQKKSFACRINHITQLNRDNLVLDTDEPLFRKTLRSRTGVIVHPKDIETDAFLKKRFTSDHANQVTGILYLLSLEFLQELIFEECETDVLRSAPAIPAILLIMLERDKAADAEKIFTSIREKLSLYLALYKNILYPNVAEYCNGTMDGALSILDYYYTLYCRVLDGSAMHLRLTSCRTPEHSYLFAFFSNRLLSHFSGKTAIVSIDPYSSFIFCTTDILSEVMKFTAAYCAQTGDFFQISPIDRNASISLNGLLSEHLKMTYQGI